MTDTIKEIKATPADVKEAFKAILDGVVEGSVVLITGRTFEGGPLHYMLARVTPDGESLMPIAIIPHNDTLLGFLVKHDEIIKKHGGPESDPDFKGVRQ